MGKSGEEKFSLLNANLIYIGFICRFAERFLPLGFPLTPSFGSSNLSTPATENAFLSSILTLKGRFLFYAWAKSNQKKLGKALLQLI